MFDVAYSFQYVRQYAALCASLSVNAGYKRSLALQKSYEGFTDETLAASDNEFFTFDVHSPKFLNMPASQYMVIVATSSARRIFMGDTSLCVSFPLTCYQSEDEACRREYYQYHRRDNSHYSHVVFVFYC